MAAYTSLARAEVGRQNLAHAGRAAKVITPPLGSRLYRLSAADLPTGPLLRWLPPACAKTRTSIKA